MKILVIGETCEDIFIYGGATRMSPEAPSLVFEPEVFPKTNKGMAANVVANLKSLAPDAEIEFFSNEKTILKTRYVDRKTNYCLLRVDQYNILPKISSDELVKISNSIKSSEAVIISDYAKGFVTKNEISAISYWCRDLKIPLFVDTKKILGKWSENINFIKINEKEYLENVKVIETPESFCENLIVTRGKSGACLIQKDEIKTSKAIGVNISDVSGAGDTFLAAFCLEFLRNSDILKAMDYANAAASVAVSMKGVVSVTDKQIQDLIKREEFIENPQ